jgi:alpha-glucosidase
MLALYRAGLRIRRAQPWTGDSTLRFIPSGEEVIAFARGDRFVCIVNFGPDPVPLPAGASVLISSNQLIGGALPQDTTVWLRQAKGQAPSGDTSNRPDHRNG